MFFIVQLSYPCRTYNYLQKMIQLLQSGSTIINRIIINYELGKLHFALLERERESQQCQIDLFDEFHRLFKSLESKRFKLTFFKSRRFVSQFRTDPMTFGSNFFDFELRIF